MGGLTRQIRFTGSRVKLVGLTPEHALASLEPWLNQVRDRLTNRAVVVSEDELSQDPEDGELLLHGGKLYLALDGEYHVLWPLSAAELPAAVVEEALRELFLYREHDVLFKYASCAINAATTVVAAVPGKRIVVRRIKVNNPDEDSPKTFHFNWGTATADNLHKGLLDSGGGTHIESFIGVPCIGGVGKALTCSVSNNGSAALHVTVGYLVLGPEELP